MLTQKKLAIVGNNLDAWITAFCLARKTYWQDDSDVSIVVIPVVEDGDGLSGQSAAITVTPADMDFFKYLGVAEKQLVSLCDGNFSLGYRYSTKADDDSAKYCTWGDYGFSHEGIEFQHLWHKLCEVSGDRLPYHQYSFGAKCAQHSKFVHPQSDPSSLLSTYAHGLCLSEKKLTDLFKNLAITGGVTCIDVDDSVVISAVVEKANTTGSNKHIEKIVLSNGLSVKAEFFVDCTTMRLQEKVGTKTSADQVHMAFDYRLSWSRKLSQKWVYTDLSIACCGWLKKSTTNTREVFSLVMDSEISDLALAKRCMSEKLSCSEQEINVTRFPRNIDSNFWVGNCLCLGVNATGMSEFGVSSLHLLHRQLDTFISLLPETGCEEVLAEEYKQFVDVLLDRVSELQEVHALVLAETLGDDGSKIANRDSMDSARGRALLGSETEVVRKSTKNINALIELFRDRATIMPLTEGLLSSADWAKILLCLGYEPQGHSPLLDAHDFEAISSKIVAGEKIIDQAVSQLPKIEVYLQHYLER